MRLIFKISVYYLRNHEIHYKFKIKILPIFRNFELFSNFEYNFFK